MARLKTTDLAAQVLSEANGPLHYIAITREVLLKGGSLRGVTPWMTLRTELMEDSRFQRVGTRARTGMYALTSWPTNMREISPEQVRSERCKAARYRQDVMRVLARRARASARGINATR